MKQVFQTHSSLRWEKFKWTIRIFAVLTIAAVTISILSLYISDLPDLPNLVLNSKRSDKSIIQKTKHPEFSNKKKSLHTINTASVSTPVSSPISEGKFLNETTDKKPQKIKAAFYVNWDLHSFKSLRDNISELNVVMPEWFVINENTDSIIVDVDQKALDLMRAHEVKIIPMLTNFVNEQWNGPNISRIISNEINRKKIIQSILNNLEKYQLQGINIDFEDLVEETDENVILFQKELYQELHKNNFLVTQDIPPGNADYNINVLQNYNDYIVLMAYDKHNPSTAAGDIAPIGWISSVLDKVTAYVPSEKLILGVCTYGYDWIENGRPRNMSFSKAMSLAKAHHSKIIFDQQSFCLHFDYRDEEGILHTIYYNDAVSAFNSMRLGYEYNVGGFAAWRLGEEDARTWSFFNRSLDADSISNLKNLTDNLDSTTAKYYVTYFGSGDVLDVLSSPQSGSVNLETDANNKIIVNENYLKYPCGYEVLKTGKKENKIVLSFDDGPDPKFTPQVINILEQEKVPASFFLLGLNIQKNMPLVKSLYQKDYEIGNHSFTHPNFTDATPERIKFELSSTRQLIQCITGCSSILFRPPYNGDDETEFSEEIYPIALSRMEHYYTIASSIDPRDWEKNITAEEIMKRVIENEKKGNIILLHDGGGNREETIKALPGIIRYFKDKGYTFTTIADLMGKNKNDVMPPEASGKEKVFSSMNFFFATFLFYGYRFIAGIFLSAIVLLVLRLLIIATLALIQKIRNKRNLPDSIYKNQMVSVIVPAYNEETTITNTIDQLLALTYEKLEIIVVDDGSSDATYDKLLFHIIGNDKVKLYYKKNGGKASALNFGIQKASGPVVVCIDADTLLKEDAIDELLKYFINDKVAAVAGNVKVGNEKNWLTKWQSIEYITGQNFDRRAFDLLNCITIVPGAIGAFRKDRILDTGGFSHQTLAEDCDLTMQFLEAGYSVKYSPHALAFTESPETISMFLKQRFRWTFGVMQSFWKHRKNFLNPKSGTMGMIAMPNILLFQFLLSAIGPLLDIVMVFSLFTGQGIQIFIYYLLFIIADAAAAILAFSFEKEDIKRLWLLFPQRIVYRWLMGFVLYKAILKAIRGELMNWGSLERTGNAKMELKNSPKDIQPLKNIDADNSITNLSSIIQLKKKSKTVDIHTDNDDVKITQGKFYVNLKRRLRFFEKN
jgi:cellulose synthase/poly-beta-1,6-N-acetylglucosamine synthase-like glycosyltransferase/spore germination protein YaaH/peptidoglycan/xylan/chitin deacetylase (PgdA/CDA1 family)